MPSWCGVRLEWEGALWMEELLFKITLNLHYYSDSLLLAFVSLSTKEYYTPFILAQEDTDPSWELYGTLSRIRGDSPQG